MCTFDDDRTVHVCDVAIGPVRADLEQRFPGKVSYIHRHGEPTRVVADGSLRRAEFRAAAEAAIAAAQDPDDGHG